MHEPDNDNWLTIADLLRESFDADFEWLMTSVGDMVEDLPPHQNRALDILSRLSDTVEAVPADKAADTMMLLESLGQAKFNEVLLYRLESLGHSFLPATATQFVERLNGDLRIAVALKAT